MERDSAIDLRDGSSADAGIENDAQRVAGRFVLRRLLNQGPETQTFLGHDDRGEVVATAIGESALAPGALMRLEYEANLLIPVESPWFAPVLFAGRDENLFWLVSRHLSGRPL